MIPGGNQISKALGIQLHSSNRNQHLCSQKACSEREKFKLWQKMKMQLELYQQHVLKLHRKLQEETNLGIKKLPKRHEKNSATRLRRCRIRRKESVSSIEVHSFKSLEISENGLMALVNQEKAQRCREKQTYTPDVNFIWRGLNESFHQKALVFPLFQCRTWQKRWRTGYLNCQIYFLSLLPWYKKYCIQ